MSWGLGWKRPSDTFHVTLSYGADDAIEDSSPKSSRSSTSSSAAVSGVGGSPSFPSSPTMSFLENSPEQLGFRIDLDWNAGEDEDQVVLRLQSQVMVALPSPQDAVEVELKEKEVDFGGSSSIGDENSRTVENGEENLGNEEGDVAAAVGVEMRVVRRREPLKGVIMWRAGGSGQQSDGMGVLLKLMRSNFANGVAGGGAVAAGDAVGLGVGPSGCSEHWKGVTVVSLCGLGLYVSTHSSYAGLECIFFP